MRETTVPETIARRGGLATVLLALLLAVAACGGQPPATPDPAGTPAAGFSPGAGLSPGASPGAGAGGGPATQPQPGGFPDTAPAYAGEILAAWEAGDLARLGELTTTLVHDQLIQIPGPVDHAWTQIQCDGGDCTFYNAAGDYVLLHVRLDQVGGPQAANHVTFQPTVYPQDHLAYLEEFVTAWQLGNLARMNALAVPQVVAVYQQTQPGPVVDYGLAGGGGGLSIVVVTTVGAEIETHIGTTLLGGPEALRHAVAQH